MREDPLVPQLTKAMGLILVTPKALTILRRRCGRGFSYVDAAGMRVGGEKRARIEALAIPPAHREVRIAPDRRYHIQAIGLDDKGRVQYRYHDDWTGVRETIKAERLKRIIACLPRIRRRVVEDLDAGDKSKDRALAAAVRLIDRAHLRAGNERYLSSNGSHGAATLKKEHVSIQGDQIVLEYAGKGGKFYERALKAPLLSKMLRRLKRMKGRRLFQYQDANGTLHQITARDINSYLKRIAGEPVTAKDFRTLAASAQVLSQLAETTPADDERRQSRQIAEAVKPASVELGNTPAVAARSYVHHSVVDAFKDGTLQQIHEEAQAQPYVSKAEAALARSLDHSSE